MSLLLDTHVLLWSATTPHRIPEQTLLAIRDAERVLVSAVSAYELTFKATLGKLSGAERLLLDLTGYLEELAYVMLPVTVQHAEAAGRLPPDHRDPFDRLLAAQALVDDLTIVSVDNQLDQFGVRRLW